MPLTLNEHISISFSKTPQMVTNGIVPSKTNLGREQMYRWRVEINFSQITFPM